jgi:hypothetical protein
VPPSGRRTYAGQTPRPDASPEATGCAEGGTPIVNCAPAALIGCTTRHKAIWAHPKLCGTGP